MIEQNMIFDLFPGVDPEAYTQWPRKTIDAVLFPLRNRESRIKSVTLIVNRCQSAIRKG